MSTVPQVHEIDRATQHESTKVQLTHLSEAILTLTNKVDKLLDMTSTVAVMQVEADNHRDRTQQMEVRFAETTSKLDAELQAEETNRILANKHIHERIDHLRKWVLTVSGGGIVVLATLGYVGESIKSFAGAYMEAHDAALRQQHKMETLEQRVNDLHKSKASPP